MQGLSMASWALDAIDRPWRYYSLNGVSYSTHEHSQREYKSATFNAVKNDSIKNII